jgi:hypothetical protein
MANLTNTIQNSVLASVAGKASAGVVNAIRQAAANTGVNFAYLVQQAQVESSFNPSAKAKTSSASGLYQFIESTWMSMVEKYGEKHGIDTEGKSKKEILAMRNDPEAASLMAAEFASENEKFLKTNWGGEVGSTELYLAHFLGAGSAAAFLKERDHNPAQQASLLFPAAAKSNYNIFYDKATGRGRSLNEVYAMFDKKFEIKEPVMQDSSVTIASADKVNIAPGAVPVPETKPVPPQRNNSLYTHSGYTAKKAVAYNPMPYYSLVSSPVELMLLAQLDSSLRASENQHKNTMSLFSTGRSYNN